MVHAKAADGAVQADYSRLNAQAKGLATASGKRFPLAFPTGERLQQMRPTEGASRKRSRLLCSGESLRYHGQQGQPMA